MNIVLIGYRCSGKTVAGKILASELGRDFLDTDALIEQSAGCPIGTIISREGWDGFRRIEKRVIEEVSRRDNLVIATGGGVVMDEDNVKNLRQNAWIVWLNGKPEVLKKRMNKDQRSGKIRPPLAGTDPSEEIDQVLRERTAFYRRASDCVVDTDSLLPKEVADAIIKALPSKLRAFL